MKFHKCLYFIILVLVTVFHQSDGVRIKKNGSELVATVTFSRHGDRSPEESFPNDAYFNETYWPMGFKQLTKFGVKRHYELGKWFRQRYHGFISDIFSPEEVYVFSTDVDRVLMSASANLAGLFPPKDFQLWNNELLWQPIPVHTTRRTQDDILVDKRECNHYDKLVKKAKKKLYADLKERFAEIFGNVGKYTGWKNDTSAKKIHTLNDVVYSYGRYNASFIPKWYYGLNTDILEFISSTQVTLYTLTKELSRLRAGPFYSYLFNHFDSFLSSFDSKNKSAPSDKHKFVMIFGHETSLTSVLNGLGAYDLRLVGFAYTAIWELRRRLDDGAYFVNLLYKKDGDHVVGLSMLNCDLDCNYEELKTLTKDVTVDVDQWKKECN